jgi:hypothetical protein
MNHALIVWPNTDGTFTLIDPAMPPPPHRPTAVGTGDDYCYNLWRLRDVLVQVCMQRAYWAIHEPEKYGGWMP